MSDTRVWATPAGVRLGSLDEVPERGARGYVIQLRAGRFHGFVVRCGGEIFGYADRCPHAGVPLARTLDDYLAPSGELIACAWHGALFRIADGRCVGGPCVGQALTCWPVAIVGGMIVTAA